MEKPEQPLEVFSAILIEDYIRLLSVANCIEKENKDEKTTFSISSENYQKMITFELQAPLIGVILDYDGNTQKLTAMLEQYVYDMYANKIMREVALKYKENYLHRYDNFIRYIE